jgi:4-amino-4-deoxy-L-arabinose transferase-like glycosyltransferase
MFTALYFEERYTGAIAPLYYALVELSTEVFGVNRWAFRFPAAVLGAVSIPTFYYLVKRVLNPATALIGSVFLVFNPWHLHYSQNARFYSGVLLFGLMAYFLFFYALRRESYWILSASILASAVSFLFHPTAIFLVASCGTYALFVLIRERWAGRENHVAEVYFGVCLLAGVVLSPFLFGIATDWIAQYSRAVSGGGAQSLTDLVYSSGVELARLSYRVFDYTGLTLIAGAFFGLLLSYRRDSYEGVFLLLSVAVPLLVLATLSQLLPAVRPRYVFYTVPVFVAGAAYLSSEWYNAYRDFPVVSGAVVSVLIVSMLPGFVSHYTAQSSLQVEDAINVVEKRYSDGDLVVAHERDAIYKISADHPDLELEKAWGEDWKKTAQKVSREGNRVWFIMNSSCVPGVLNELESWLIDHASLVWRRHRKGFVHGLTGYEVWVMEAK